MRFCYIYSLSVVAGSFTGETSTPVDADLAAPISMASAVQRYIATKEEIFTSVANQIRLDDELAQYLADSHIECFGALHENRDKHRYRICAGFEVLYEYLRDVSLGVSRNPEDIVIPEDASREWAKHALYKDLVNAIVSVKQAVVKRSELIVRLLDNRKQFIEFVRASRGDSNSDISDLGLDSDLIQSAYRAKLTDSALTEPKVHRMEDLARTPRLPRILFYSNQQIRQQLKADMYTIWDSVVLRESSTQLTPVWTVDEWLSEIQEWKEMSESIGLFEGSVWAFKNLLDQVKRTQWNTDHTATFEQIVNKIPL